MVISTPIITGTTMIHFFGDLVFMLDITGIHLIILTIVILHFIIATTAHTTTEIILRMAIIFITVIQIIIHTLIHIIH